MKKIIILSVTFFTTCLGFSQNVLPVEQNYLYKHSSNITETKDYEEDGISEVKDVNNVLRPFLGTWTTIIHSNGNSVRYIFKVERGVFNSSVSIEQDILNIKYSIEERISGNINWTEIINTFNLPIPNDLSYIRGNYLDREGYYRLFYNGEHSGCGQRGTIFLFPPTTTRNTLGLGYSAKAFPSPWSNCPNGIAEQVLPIENIFLEKIVLTNFATDASGWVANGAAQTVLENGRLKVTVDSQFEGIRRELPEFDVAPGDIFNVSVSFDKGTTNAAVRLYFQEIDANGSHLSWNVMEGDLQSGTSTYQHTVRAGRRLTLRIDKTNTHLNETTNFYVDQVTVTKQ